MFLFKLIFIGLLIVNYKFVFCYIKMLFAVILGIVGVGLCFSIIGIPIGIALINKMTRIMAEYL